MRRVIDMLGDRERGNVEELIDRLLTLAVNIEKDRSQSPKAHEQLEYIFRCLADFIISIATDRDDAMIIGDRIAHKDEAEYSMRAAVLVEAFASFSEGGGGDSNSNSNSNLRGTLRSGE